ncbi:MAG: hypothetical protein Q3972_02115 [Corynebacterium sp.]|nr:hypothetical protein [Corynebacterium sp.]
MKKMKTTVLSICAVLGLVGAVLSAPSPSAQAEDAPIQFRIWSYSGMPDGKIFELSARSILGNILFAAPFGALLAFLVANGLNMGIESKVLPPIPLTDSSS